MPTLRVFEKKVRAGILTVENLGFIEDVSQLEFLFAAGVKMASLVWNNKNQFASPNLVFENGLPQFEKRVDEGLSGLGKEAVERLDYNKIIIDISHLSDAAHAIFYRAEKSPPSQAIQTHRK